LEETLEAQQTSPLGYVSEFKPIETLAPLFKCHPCWNKMKSVLVSHRSISPLAPLSKDKRTKDVREALQFGNRKGTEQQQHLLRELVKDEVNQGFALLLPLNKIASVPGPRRFPSPFEYPTPTKHKQCGKTIPKNRLTHDQSWKWQSGTLVNSRVDSDQLMPCYFGKALERLINWAVAAR
jgi:hypothetical protein